MRGDAIWRASWRALVVMQSGERRGGRACVEKQSGERRGGSAMELFVGVTCLIRQGGGGGAESGREGGVGV